MKKHGINAGELLRRQASGDWSDLCEEDRAENGRALRMGSRFLPAYDDAELGTSPVYFRPFLARRQAR